MLVDIQQANKPMKLKTLHNFKLYMFVCLLDRMKMEVGASILKVIVQCLAQL